MIRAIDGIGQIVDYLTADRWVTDIDSGVTLIYTDKELTAAVPWSWIVKRIPPTQVDPGVEARD